ncbi:MAG: hypothetical protein E2P01_09150 [Acidobacteria bacterium]|nr:MAG: hypothetical protein E2P01_09150 [Acidobacteriota bacterium]
MSRTDGQARHLTLERAGVPGIATAAVFGLLIVALANHLALWISSDIEVGSPMFWMALVLDVLAAVTMSLSFALAYALIASLQGPQDSRKQVVAALTGTLLATVVEAVWFTWSPFIRIAGIFLVVELFVLFTVATVSYAAAFVWLTSRRLRTKTT